MFYMMIIKPTPLGKSAVLHKRYGKSGSDGILTRKVYDTIEEAEYNWSKQYLKLILEMGYEERCNK